MSAPAPAADLELRRAPLGSFRVRGRRIGRLEALSDAVFGFSATLLVVSLEVPETFAELAASLEGFGAFGLSFLALVLIWSAHHGFFRRYGLHDSWTTIVNMVLLFVVLFFVYPLKFLSVTFVEWAFGISTRMPGEEALRRFGSQAEVTSLFVIYGLGFAAVFLCFALLYRRALAARRELRLDRAEVYDCRSIIGHYLILAAMALVSVTLAALGWGVLWGGIAGWIYGFLGPVMTVYWMVRARRREAVSR